MTEKPSRSTAHLKKKPLEENFLAGDLDNILVHTQGLWEELREKRLFITGGTGFFGRWLLESFAWANHKLALRASAVVLTRNHAAFKKTAPHLAANTAIAFHAGDIRDFKFPGGEFSHIIHAAATSAVTTFEHVAPLMTFDIMVQGTRHLLDFAVQCGAKKVLLTSSGPVYGRQPADIAHIPEEYCGAPDPCQAAFFLGESKRAAEMLCALYAQTYGIETKIARCFSFVGPCLPLDIHYAIGNFIRDALKGGPIHINGDGTPFRSYLYASDLIIWLWTILFRGEACRPYNVGSEDSLTIAEVASTVGRLFQPPPEIIIAGVPVRDAQPERYVPSTRRARSELGVRQTVALSEALEKTIAYHLLLRPSGAVPQKTRRRNTQTTCQPR